MNYNFDCINRLTNDQTTLMTGFRVGRFDSSMVERAKALSLRSLGIWGAVGILVASSLLGASIVAAGPAAIVGAVALGVLGLLLSYDSFIVGDNMSQRLSGPRQNSSEEWTTPPELLDGTVIIGPASSLVNMIRNRFCQPREAL